MAWANGRVGAASGDRRCSLVTGLSTNRIMASAALSPHLAKETATLAILFLPTEPLAQAVLRVPMSPEDLLGRDRSLSGPAPQTLALSEKSPYLRSSPGLGQLLVRSASPTRTASLVGTDLRAVRRRRHWRCRRNRPTWGADSGNPIQDDAGELTRGIPYRMMSLNRWLSRLIGRLAV